MRIYGIFLSFFSHYLVKNFTINPLDNNNFFAFAFAFAVLSLVGWFNVNGFRCDWISIYFNSLTLKMCVIWMAIESTAINQLIKWRRFPWVIIKMLDSISWWGGRLRNNVIRVLFEIFYMEMIFVYPWCNHRMQMHMQLWVCVFLLILPFEREFAHLINVHGIKC